MFSRIRAQDGRVLMQRQFGLIAVVAIAAIVLAWFVFPRPSPDPNSQLPGDGTEVVDESTMPLPATFAFMRLEVDTANNTPEACLVFSESLDESGDTTYGNFLEISPRVKPSLRVAGHLLCIGGLSFNQMYEVTLREGLPAASGNRVPTDEVVPVELRDRPAAAAFGGGVLLPRDAGGTIPVTTVNIDTLSIRVLRVGDRLLSQLRQGLLDESELYRYDARTLENEQAALIWQGEMDVEAVPNESVVTRFPISDVLGDAGPGAYLILGEDTVEASDTSNYWRGTAAQWVIETDLGLTSFLGESGLDVHVRSLASARTLRNVELQLVARNNDVLATATTDGGGTAHFGEGFVRGTGGLEPVAVMAYGARGDFTFLDLRRPAFDLSDRGVSGRATPGPIDAFLFTDRGIYRPGETVELMTLLRDREAIALNDAPLTLVVTRPDGVEYRRETIGEQQAGAIHYPVALSRTARHGWWRASAYVDTDAAPVGQVSFEVQDFVPERLEVTATPREALLTRGDEIAIDVRARFLYGAPAANIGGEAELRLEHDTAPFAAYAEFQFGRVEESINARFQPLDMPSTDENGETVATGSLNALPPSTWPLRGRMRIAVFEPGGRSTSTQAQVAIRTNDVYLGIRSAFDGRFVRDGAEAAFEFVAVDREGGRVALEGAHWEIVREIRNYQWYEVDGQWRFEPISRDRAVRAGTVRIGTDEIASISETLPWGTYRLVVTDADGDISSSVRFYSGWWGATSPDRPDQLIVTAVADEFDRGGRAEITIRPDVAGPAVVVIANEGIIETRNVDVPADGLRLSFDVTEEWGAGAYALVTHFRALDEGNSRAPVRSVGVTYLNVDHSDRILDVSINAPEIVTPQSRVSIPVEVANLAGETAYLTLAAVDQGILQLTGFVPPNPEEHYFGKHRLGIEMRDDYGRLIQAQDGALGVIRSGGDASLGGAGLTVVPTRTVALFSGLVALDEDGRATVEFDIPDFAGELRLMAMTVSDTKVGQADARLTVRDALVGELSLPRFIAPGDRALATLSLHNVDGASGTYAASIGATDGMGVEQSTHRFDLNEGEREEVRVPIFATDIGIATVSLDLSGPDGFTRNRTWPIEVRPSQLPETREEIAVLEGGASYAIPTDAMASLIPATAEVSLSLSTTRGLDTSGLLRALDRYPFGCLEQTVSRAYPLLYFGDLAGDAGLEADEGLDIRLQNSVDRVLDMQRSNGAFGMWGYASSEAEAWLSLYALDFLTEADRRGLVVPDDAVRRGLTWISNIAGQSWRDNQIRAHAYYILAKEGRAVPGDLRYFHDIARAQMNDVMALAHLGGALDAIGDRARAAASFDRAIRLAAEANPREYEAYRYGSLTRDLAGLTTMIARGGRLGMLPALFDRLGELAPRLRYTTTQEKAWLLFAADALSRSGAELDVAITNAALISGEDPVNVLPTTEEIGIGVVAANEGGDVWRNLAVMGVPTAPQDASAQGLTFSRSYFRMDGSTADLANVAQNERLVVLLEGRMTDNYYREMIALDLLPAGFEIESLVYGGTYSWLPALTPTQTQEARDDRYVAAFNIGNRYRPLAEDNDGNPIRPRFALAYLARAITPGEFVRPPAYVEDMYQPRVAARTEMGTLSVAVAE